VSVWFWFLLKRRYMMYIYIYISLRIHHTTDISFSLLGH